MENPASPARPAGLGRRPDIAEELGQLADANLTPGRVLAQHRGYWLVAPLGDAPPALVQTRTRTLDEIGGSPVAGDWVALDEAGAIAHVLERRGTIERHDVGARAQAQVLAANVDVALIVEAFPEPNVRRAERLIALAAAGDVRPLLVLTKADLAEDVEQDAPALARELGLVDAYPVSATARATAGFKLRPSKAAAREADAPEPAAASAADGERDDMPWPATDGAPDDTPSPADASASGLDALRGELAPGHTAVLLGVSGAGKSTLANALLGEQRQATQEIRESTGRGRHTTVARELLALPGGALLIDGPGIRRINLWDGTGASFTEIERLAADCRFADCRHDSEPGCAVRDAVGGERLEAWRKLEREQTVVDGRRAAARVREQGGRQHTRAQRAARRRKDRRGDGGPSAS